MMTLLKDLSIAVFPPRSLNNDLCNTGLSFIKRRFRKVWGVDRFDVTYGRVFSRHNVVLRSDNRLIAWLGLEDDGELVNACVEQHYPGVSLLRDICKHTMKHAAFDYYYAETPIERLSSAKAFLMAGLAPTNPPVIVTMVYPERAISLVRLALYHRSEKLNAVHAGASLDKHLDHIRSLRRYDVTHR